MKAPGAESDRANPEMDQGVVTSDRCGGWMPSLHLSRGTDEDGRDGKESPTIRMKEQQGQITRQHFTRPASCWMYV